LREHLLKSKSKRLQERVVESQENIGVDNRENEY